MIGEFAGTGGEKYALVVNLSLGDSGRLTLTPRGVQGEVHQVSPADGSLLPLEAGNSVWLAAGQGVLLKCPPPRNAAASGPSH